MSMIRVLKLYGAGVLFWLLSLNVYAQTGTIRGSIQSETGQPLVGINVGLQETTFGSPTNSQGSFVIRNVPPGTYTLQATGVGYTATKQNITVVAGKSLTLDLQLNQAAQTLNDVIVRGQRSYAITELSPTTRLSAPLIETPQNIVSVSSQVLRDQQATDIAGVVGNVSGVTQGSPNPFLRPDFIIRGSSVDKNKLRNGIGGFTMNPYEDAAIIDHVEFIKGPAGFMLSNAEPGGLLNIVTKQAVKTSLLDLTAMTGRYSFYRVAVDAGGSLTKNGKLYYRLNGAYQTQMTAVDFYGFRRTVLAPVLTYDISPRTTITAEYNLIYGQSVGGVDPTVPGANGQYWTLPNNFSQNDYTLPTGFARSQYSRLNLQHRLSDAWKLTAQLGYYAEDRVDYNYYSTDYNYFTGYIDATGTIVTRGINYYAQRYRNSIGQVFLTGNFQTGHALKHTVLIGFDGANVTGGTKYPDPTIQKEVPLNTKNPVYGVPYSVFGANLMVPDTFDNQSYYNFSWRAGYIQDHIKLLDKVVVTLAGRYTAYQTPQTTEVEQSKAFTPRAGLTWLINDHVSAYGLYDQSFVHQAGRSFSGGRFKPLRGNNIEFGLKGQWLNGRLQTNLAVYQITKNNLLASDPLHANFSVQLDKQVSKGVEVDVLGALTNNLNVVANYAYTDSRTHNTDAGGDVPTFMVPKNNANVWLRYTLTHGTLNGLSLSLGLNVIDGSRAVSFGQTNAVYAPGYQLVNGAVSYQRRRLRLALNGTNLLNMRYMPSGIYISNTWFYTPSNPVDFRLSASYRL